MILDKKVAIHGVGMVGGAVSRYFLAQGKDVRNVDPPKGMEDNIEDVELHFLCVPTPFEVDGSGFDDQYLYQACDRILQARGDQETVIVIKSTVLPGTTAALQEKYPHYIFLFNPEFLTEKNADHDMLHPERQILGYMDERGEKLVDQLFELLPKAPYEQAMRAPEAELVKYFGNTFLSVKVVFANVMYDFCEQLGLNYDVIKDAAAMDSRIGPSHLKVLHDGYRGYAGSCFPKDIRALIQKGDELGIDVGLLKEAERRNNEIRGLN